MVCETPINFAGRQVLPMMLSPMAGITTAPFRQMCTKWAQRGLSEISGSGVNDVIPGLFVNDMAAASTVAGSSRKAHEHLQFAPNEGLVVGPEVIHPSLRSAQIWCTSAQDASEAMKRIVDENLADHVDLNFGCPTRKVTSVGGGAAVPLHLDLMRAIVSSAVSAANGQIPVTAKFRIGLDQEHIYFSKAGIICVEEGVEAVTLHARTAEQYYSGEADWNAIRQLCEEIRGVSSGRKMPVFGNGDIFSPEDAGRMVSETSCDGVTIGRGANGRPWLFYELLTGKNPIRRFGDVADVIREHLDLQITFAKDVQEKGERRAIEDFRVYITPYLKGFEISGNQKRRLLTASSRSRFEEILLNLDQDQPYDLEAANRPRGKTNAEPQVYLPDNWLP
jgi:nifR3 family TIM-barrel protein